MLCIGIAQAQNYRTIRAGSEMYFENPEGVFRAFKADSIATRNQDTAVYNYRHIREKENEPFCFTSKGASWLGEFVLIRPDGMNVYFNLMGDSIFIKTLALLNETWRVYTCPDGRKIMAKIVAHQVEEFLGLSDSVKIIQLSILNADGTQVLNSALMELKLSKHYGFIKTTNFYVFPEYNAFISADDEYSETYSLVGLSDPHTGKVNLTSESVFDLEVGDEIHESYYEEAENFIFENTVKYVTGKKKYADTIEYIILEKKQQIVVSYPSSGKELKDTSYYNRSFKITSNDYSFLDSMPDEPILGNWKSSATYMRSHLNGRGLKVRKYFFSDRNSCLEPIADAMEGVFYEGLGGPYGKPRIFVNSHHDIVYYKKGAEVWGTPHDFVSSINEAKPLQTLRIYPNPAKDKLTIKGISQSFTFGMMNVFGQPVIENTVTEGTPSVDISALPAGIYFLKVMQGGRERIVKVVKH